MALKTVSGFFLSSKSFEMGSVFHHLKPSLPRYPMIEANQISSLKLDAVRARVIWPFHSSNACCWSSECQSNFRGWNTSCPDVIVLWVDWFETWNNWMKMGLWILCTDMQLFWWEKMKWLVFEQFGGQTESKWIKPDQGGSNLIKPNHWTKSPNQISGLDPTKLNWGWAKSPNCISGLDPIKLNQSISNQTESVDQFEPIQWVTCH